jgi:hypothetical protein
VLFVSLTNLPRADVESFVKHFSLPWPCGYASSPEALVRFGAYSTRRARTFLGSEVTPTLYLIGADGHVLWNDAQARPRHLKDNQTLLRELDAEIERALGSSTH